MPRLRTCTFRSEVLSQSSHDASTAWPLAPVTPDAPLPVLLPLLVPLPPFFALLPLPPPLRCLRFASVLLLNSGSGALKIGMRDFVLGNLPYTLSTRATDQNNGELTSWWGR